MVASAAKPMPAVRLAELVASLTLAIDLGRGQPQEHVLRQTVIASRLARLAGLPEDAQATTYYVSLMAWVGCVADSHEMAGWFGDDNQLRVDIFPVNKVGLPLLRFLIDSIPDDVSPLHRISMTGQILAGGLRSAKEMYVMHCQVAGDIAERLGLHEDVCRALPQAFARWDGRGVPVGLGASDIEPVMRVVHIAEDAEVFHRIGGTDAAIRLLRDRAGSEFDPELVTICCDNADQVFAGLESIDAWSEVIDGCATLDRGLDDAELTGVLRVFADYADLKSPWFTGHSRAVGTLAAAAATHAGLSTVEITLVERAGLVARLGALGVSAGVWDKPGALSAAEWERVRTVPYLTERILSRQPRLAEIGQIAGMCRERMDGSGYPRGLSGAAIPQAARVLAAAARYQTLSEDRPHRSTVDAATRDRMLSEEVAAGQLDAAAVRAVLTAAGRQVRSRPALVAGLSAREVEVLALLVRGRTNKEIAERLSISASTVGSHVEHIYTKIGVATRGAAAMFAMRHGLVDAAAWS
jgi:HD-GYP domain-containing protein (c-di-GMP phosphodiesterase class II)